MFETKDLTKSFSNLTLRYPDIQVDKGGFVHICGASGSGKSTLCEMIAKFTRIDSGSISINGKEIQNQNVFESIHYVSQFPEHNLIGPTCYDEIELWLQSQPQSDTKPDKTPRPEGNLEKNDTKDFIYTKLKEFFLKDMQEKPIWKLSFGQKKALAFCALSIIKREIWVLDEPWAGCDNSLSEKIEELMSEHLNNQGMIIATSHDLLSRQTSSITPLQRGIWLDRASTI